MDGKDRERQKKREAVKKASLPAKAGLHDRHRERMRQKYREARDSLADHELLEIFLFPLLPRKNTNPLAHALIERFGSLDGVMEADPAALCQVEGIGEKTAFALSQVSYLWRRSEEAKERRGGEALDTTDRLGRYFLAKYRGVTEEVVYLLLLDSRARPIDCRKLSEGLVDCSEIDCARIVEMAQLRKATRVVLAHNHPGGIAQPSDSDMTVTRYLRRVLAPIGIRLEEHILVADGNYYPLSAAEEK